MQKLSTVLFIHPDKNHCSVPLANSSVPYRSLQHLVSMIVVILALEYLRMKNPSHRDFFLKFKNWGNDISRIDNQHLGQDEDKVTYWRNVPKQLFLNNNNNNKLCSRDPYFVEMKRCLLGEKLKVNNMFELITEFDSFLSDQIAGFGNIGEESMSYLAPVTYEGITCLMGK